MRRAAQLRLIRPDIEPAAVRGNVDTRVGKVEAGEVDAVIVAAAALSRLGWLERATELLPLESILPAPGQGALAVQAREGDEEARNVVATIDDFETRAATNAERAFLRRLGGGCRVPVAACATFEDGELRLEGLVADPEGKQAFRGEISGNADEAESLGEELAETLLSDGAGEVLERLSP